MCLLAANHTHLTVSQIQLYIPRMAKSHFTHIPGPGSLEFSHFPTYLMTQRQSLTANVTLFHHGSFPYAHAHALVKPGIKDCPIPVSIPAQRTLCVLPFPSNK